MQYWGKFLNFIKQNKKSLTILLAIVIIIAAAISKTNSPKNNGTQVKASEKVSEKELKRIIAENKEKYFPKTGWLENNPQTLPVSAKSSVILDFNTNELLFADNKDEKLPPASITKVLTAAIVLENMDINKICTISEKAAETEPNKISMIAGEKLKVEDLLYGLMMISANDAAEALAECYEGGRDEFIGKMNQKVKELGLVNTHFMNPSGLDDPNHYSSAFDMATITNYAIKSNPEFMKYFGNKGSYSVYASENNEPHWWSQISNLLQTYPGMDGAKTGFTYDAGNTYIGTAKRDDRRIIIVYLNANSTTYDATMLLDQGFYLEPNN